MASKKVCRTCGEEKFFLEFYRAPSYADNYNLDCRSCMKANRKPTELERIRKNSLDTKSFKYQL